MTIRGVVLTCLMVSCCWGATASLAHAEDRHYVLVFGGRTTPRQAKYSHTWATFVRVVGEGSDPTTYQLIVHTISFLPETLNVRTFALKPEASTNLDLTTTLALLQSRDVSMAVWGPFLIKPEVYQRSLEVWSLHSSGAVEYRAIDSIRNHFIADCIHAVSAVDPQFGRAHYPLIRVGKNASRYIARQVVTRNDPDRVMPDQTWLIAALGLNQYPIEVILPSQIPQRREILVPRGD